MKDLLRSKVNSSQVQGTGVGRAAVYAAHSDFCRIFMENMNRLYLLSLLLTADQGKAEQCFMAGFEDSLQGNPVFQEWAHSWTRRTIINNAIQMINPAPHGVRSTPEAICGQGENTSGTNPSIAAIVRLESFERFVFVMSVLEGYSNQECAVLLHCAPQDVSTGRTRALQQLPLDDVGLDTPVRPGSKGFHDEHSWPLVGAA